MKSIILFAILTLASFHLSSLPGGATPAETTNQEAGDKEIIFNNAKAFADAFEKEDAKALAAFWAEDGDLWISLVAICRAALQSKMHSRISFWRTRA
jgi:hypothetical protein